MKTTRAQFEDYLKRIVQLEQLKYCNQHNIDGEKTQCIYATEEDIISYFKPLLDYHFENKKNPPFVSDLDKQQADKSKLNAALQDWCKFVLAWIEKKEDVFDPEFESREDCESFLILIHEVRLWFEGKLNNSIDQLKGRINKLLTEYVDICRRKSKCGPTLTIEYESTETPQFIREEFLEAVKSAIALVLEKNYDVLDGNSFPFVTFHINSFASIEMTEDTIAHAVEKEEVHQNIKRIHDELDNSDEELNYKRLKE